MHSISQGSSSNSSGFSFTSANALSFTRRAPCTSASSFSSTNSSSASTITKGSSALLAFLAGLALSEITLPASETLKYSVSFSNTICRRETRLTSRGRRSSGVVAESLSATTALSFGCSVVLCSPSVTSFVFAFFFFLFFLVFWTLPLSVLFSSPASKSSRFAPSSPRR